MQRGFPVDLSLPVNGSEDLVKASECSLFPMKGASRGIMSRKGNKINVQDLHGKSKN